MPRGPRLSDTFRELSRLCMTSITVVRCDQRRTETERRNDPGSATAVREKRFHRAPPGSPGWLPSVSKVLSRPMKLLPRP